MIKAPFFDKVLFEGFFFLKGKNAEIMVNALKLLKVKKKKQNKKKLFSPVCPEDTLPINLSLRN